MADSNSSSRSTAQDFCGMLSLASVCRACKSFVTSKKQPSEKNSAKAEPQEEEITRIDRIRKASEEENQKKKTLSSPSLRYNDNDTSTSTSGGGLFNNYPSTLSRSATATQSRNGPSPLSRSTSQRSQAHTRSGPIATLLKSISKKNVDPTPTVPSSLSRTTSRSGPMPIMYSNSTGLVKPPAMEKQLECTLDELCLGCTKKVTITRDVVKDNGQIVEEDEELTIKVKPGWTKGTKIKFEGMGNETPGTEAADLNFVIAEKKHHLFRREGDNLKLAIEVPLVKALTGCTLSIPLVGGEKTSVKIDDIIYPGHEKIIEGQGMPMAKEKGKRGNLIVKFQVQFPEKLTYKQRSDVYCILQSSFDKETVLLKRVYFCCNSFVV